MCNIRKLGDFAQKYQMFQAIKINWSEKKVLPIPGYVLDLVSMQVAPSRSWCAPLIDKSYNWAFWICWLEMDSTYLVRVIHLVAMKVVSL